MQAKEGMVQRGGFIAEVAFGIRALFGDLKLVPTNECYRSRQNRYQTSLYSCTESSPLSPHTAHWIV
jgi:hypothetical protein